MNKDLFDQGMAIRRAVLGDAYVDGAMASADATALLWIVMTAILPTDSQIWESLSPPVPYRQSLPVTR